MELDFGCSDLLTTENRSVKTQHLSLLRGDAREHADVTRSAALPLSAVLSGGGVAGGGSTLKVFCKTHIQHKTKCLYLNMVRILSWLASNSAHLCSRSPLSKAPFARAIRFQALSRVLSGSPSTRCFSDSTNIKEEPKKWDTSHILFFNKVQKSASRTKSYMDHVADAF